MGLITLDEIRSLLACPRCGAALVDANVTEISGIEAMSGLSCTRDSCPYHASAFPWVRRWPILVDFERSVISRTGVTQAVDIPPVSSAMGGWATWLRGLIRPRNRVAQHNITRMCGLLDGHSPLVLVIGGGTVGNGVEGLYRDRSLRLLAFDIFASDHTQFVADTHQIPLADCSVDAIVVQAVLEHVLDPWQAVNEMHRVLSPNGLVYAETPFLQQVHAGAYDFTRFTESGHRWLFRRFTEVDRGVVAGPGTQLLWTVDHLVRSVFHRAWLGRVFRLLLCWLRLLDAVVPEPFAIDTASAVFFLGRKSDHAISPREAVAGYRGAQWVS